MGRRYAPEVLEAVWALKVDGVTTTEIERRLADGTAGLPQRIEIPRRSLNELLRRLKEERGEFPQATVEPGTESDTAQALLRECLSVLKRETNYVAAASRAGRLRSTELNSLDKIAKTTLDIERRLRELNAGPQSNREAAARESGSGSPSPLSAIRQARARQAELEQRNGAGPNGTDPDPLAVIPTSEQVEENPEPGIDAGDD